MKIVAWGLNDVTLSNRLHSNEGDGLIMGVFLIHFTCREMCEEALEESALSTWNYKNNGCSLLKICGM